MPRKKAELTETEIPDDQPLTISFTVGKRHYKRLLEIGKPLDMSPDETAKIIVTKKLG